jgi:hypothetical protein
MAAKFTGMKKMTDEDLRRLTLDPHNIVYGHKEAPAVPDDQRQSPQDMHTIVSTTRAAFLVALEADEERKDESKKERRSRIRHALCEQQPELENFWRVHPRVFNKITSETATQEDIDLILQMIDIRREAEESGGGANAGDKAVESLLMSKFAKDGSLADNGVTLLNPNK